MAGRLLTEISVIMVLVVFFSDFGIKTVSLKNRYRVRLSNAARPRFFQGDRARVGAGRWNKKIRVSRPLGSGLVHPQRNQRSKRGVLGRFSGT